MDRQDDPASRALDMSDACNHNLSAVLNPLDSNLNSTIMQPIEQIADTLEDDIQRDSAGLVPVNPIHEDEVNRNWFANAYSLIVK